MLRKVLIVAGVAAVVGIGPALAGGQFDMSNNVEVIKSRITDLEKRATADEKTIADLKKDVAALKAKSVVAPGRP